VPIELQKPNNKIFANWATMQGKDKLYPDRDVVHMWVIAWVMRDPKVLDSYTNLSEDELKTNEFIYNPLLHNGTGLSYVSPRGLVACSDVLYAYQEGLIDKLTMDIGLTGILGDAGGSALAAIGDLIHKVPTADEIRNNPEGCKLSTDSGALTMTCLGAAKWIEDRSDAQKWFTYMNRIDRSEFHSIFMMQASADEDLKNHIVSTREFQKWSKKYNHLFDRAS